MKKIVYFLLLLVAAALSDITPSYSTLEKQTPFNPDFSTGSANSHSVSKKDPKTDFHPVYRGEDLKNEKRGMSDKHKEMLSDQPAGSTEVNRIDNVAIPNHAYAAPMEVLYPDVPYAPGYSYENGYPSNNYDGSYSNGLTNYLENDSSPYNFFWNLVPKSRTFVSFIGNAISWFLSSIFVLLLGSLLTVGVCTYTNICKIHINGIGPIHEEMRSLMTPERLEKISTAADFVKTAIDKYQTIQTVPQKVRARRELNLFY